MFDANNDAGCPVPLPEFHNAALSDALDLRDEYKRYVEDLEAMPHHSSALMRPSPPRSICQVCLADRRSYATNNNTGGSSNRTNNAPAAPITALPDALQAAQKYRSS
eukprot:364216-Chlamydomonas_euryale.AAC.2